MRPRAFLVALLAIAPLVHAAELPHYRAAQKVVGEIRIWGSPEDSALVASWDEGFRRFHPQARLVASLHGPESTLACLYTGACDIAFVGRELRIPTDNMAFQWVKLYRPTTIEIASAGLTARRPSESLAVFVHPSNPLAGLTVAQLEAIFGAEHKHGNANARTWGDLGLAGEWRDRPIHAIALPVTTIPALFFRKVVLDDSRKWNEDMKEMEAQPALEAVAADPAAIAYAPMSVASEAVRAVPLGKGDGALVELTPASAADRSYPLARAVIVAVDKPVGKPLDARVGEFVRFLLSEEGQAAVARDGAYVALTPAAAAKQAKKLDSP